MNEATLKSAGWEISHDSIPSMAAAIWITVVGSFALLILPLLMGVMTDEMGLNPQQMGFLASADLTGMGLSSGLAIFWVRRLPWRLSASVSLLVLMGSNLLTMQVSHFETMLLVRFVAGFAGGAAMAVGLSCQSDSRHSNRLFGFFVSGQCISAMLGFFLLGMIKEKWGLDGILLGITAFCVPALLLVSLLPNQGVIRQARQLTQAQSWTRPVLSLIAAYFFFTSIGGLWAFVERIGIAAGIDASDVSTALAMAAGVALMGALGAIWLIERFGLPRMIMCILVGLVSAFTLFSYIGSYAEFFLALCIFQFSFGLGIPLMMSIINSIDSSGLLIVMLLAVIKLGYATGPALMGLLVSEGSYTGVCFASGVLCTAGLMGSLVLLRR